MESTLFKEESIWLVEITDLGASKPFLGYSLTDQYVLVGITSPTLQNEVCISSMPQNNQGEMSISLPLDKFDVPFTGILKFEGIKKLKDKWCFQLHDKREEKIIELKEKDSIKLGQSNNQNGILAFGYISANKIQRQTRNCLELIIRSKNTRR